MASDVGASPQEGDSPENDDEWRDEDAPSGDEEDGDEQQLEQKQNSDDVDTNDQSASSESSAEKRKDAPKTIAQLKREALKGLPKTLPPPLVRLLNGEEFDAFLADCVAYVNIYVKAYRREQLERGQGFERVKRLYLASLRRPERKTSAGLTTSVAALTADSDDGLDELDLPTLLHLRNDAMLKIGAQYSILILQFGANMNFVVERQFYEQFYNFIGEFFRAASSLQDWTIIHDHVNQLFRSTLGLKNGRKPRDGMGASDVITTLNLQLGRTPSGGSVRPPVRSRQSSSTTGRKSCPSRQGTAHFSATAAPSESSISTSTAHLSPAASRRASVRFSLRKVINARSPLISQVMPTYQDQAEKVISRSRIIITRSSRRTERQPSAKVPSLTTLPSRSPFDATTVSGTFTSSLVNRVGALHLSNDSSTRDTTPSIFADWDSVP
ncbi:hypothetical protein RI367_007495 [Sorochytrium milnesiophthora]